MRLLKSSCLVLSVALVVGVALSSSVSAAAASIRLTKITAEPTECKPNLAPNPSFEQVDANGIPTGWHWDRRNTDATCVVDTSVAHSGRNSLRITNGTPYGPHVYGMLWQIEPTRLVEGKTYTISLWMKSDGHGTVQLIGGGRWEYRTAVSGSDGQWRRAWTTFTATATDVNFILRVNTETPTSGVWIDDIKVEEGSLPTFDPVDGRENVDASLSVDDGVGVVQGDGPFRTSFVLSAPRAVAGRWNVSMNTGETLEQPINLAAGNWHITIDGHSEAIDDSARTLTVRLADADKDAAAIQTEMRFYSRESALARLAKLNEQLPLLKKDLEAVQTQGQDISYPDTAMTILENFTKYAEQDARGNEVQRAIEQIGELETMAAELRKQLDDARDGKRPLPGVPRWTGQQRPTVKGSSFLAPVRMPGGETVERPVFFTGFGHFGQVVHDMEKWPHYGTNIIQIEFGPNRVFPADGVTDDKPMKETLATLDRAQKAGVSICLLISPHYFPHWALEKWPHLNKGNAGFLKYCLHAPEGQELLHRFVVTAIAPLKDHPALHSICISNEPVNQEEPCAAAKQQWLAWIQDHHSDIATLNARYGSTFASFADVPLPNPCAPRPSQAAWMDYIRFNQEFFAGWHKLLADAVHEVAPSLPVHAKAMTWTMVNSVDLHFGVDATLFGRLSNINGNDAVNFYDFSEGEFAQGWIMNAMGHDLQRSTLDAPVFNTENHVIADRDPRYVPPSHIRSALWQAAVRGQSATTIWVWERTSDMKSDLACSIMLRPACTAAACLVNHDLNRAALEMTALQQAKPQALLLQSTSALAWEGQAYDNCQQKLYTALSFTGLKLGFATERQLEEGIVPEAPVLFVPNVHHFSDAALAGLKKFQGRIVFVGDEKQLDHDDYGRTRDPQAQAEWLACTLQTQPRELSKQINARLAGWNAASAIAVQDENQQAAWGVEWRTADTPQGTVVNLCNYLKKPVGITLTRDKQAVVANDVLSGERVSGPLTLAPLEVRLLRLEGAGK